MTVFWIVAALFVGAALLFLLPPLLAPRVSGLSLAGANGVVHGQQLREAEDDLAAGLISPERLQQLQREAARRLREDSAPDAGLRHTGPARRTALLLALLVPLASVLTYRQLGRPEGVAPQLAARSEAAAGARHAVTAEQIQQMVSALAERLQAQPADREGWLMLGRSYTALGRYRDAAAAFRRALELAPPEAGLLADLADVTGMAQGKRLAGEPARLIQQALDADPRHVKALALAGSVAFEARDYAAARGYWQRLLTVVPADSPVARSVQGSIAEATQLEQGGAAPGGAAAAEAVQGEVVVSPALAARVRPGDTLFVFARAEQGPRMPLAIQRLPLQGGPLRFRLDDSQAMAPNLRLSGFDRVVLGARISRSGNATPQSGDLVGQSGPLAPGTRDVQIVIDRVQP